MGRYIRNPEAQCSNCAYWFRSTEAIGFGACRKSKPTPVISASGSVVTETITDDRGAHWARIKMLDFLTREGGFCGKHPNALLLVREITVGEGQTNRLKVIDNEDS